MIQEAMNKKTINELNESNKKLMEKVKFYQQQKENNKKKDNKVADYLNNGLIEKIELLEKEKEDLIHKYEDQHNYSCEMGDFIDKQKEEKDKLKEKVELLEKEKEELIEECKEKNVKNEQLEEENKRITFKMELMDKQISKQLNVFHEVKSAIDNLKITQDETLGDIW
jgi:chromosome segregation ATPase